MTARDLGNNLMSIPQVAEYLGLAERTVLMWAQTGKLPSFKMGVVWRFRRTDIDQWLETQRSGPEVSSPMKPLTDSIEPPRSKSKQADDDRRTQEAMVEACLAYFSNLMEDKDRTTWVIEQVEEQFDAKVVKEAVRRLVKDKKVSTRSVSGLHGQKVSTIYRR